MPYLPWRELEGMMRARPCNWPGKPEAGPWRVQLLSTVVDAVTADTE
jgi:hypothetical protein